MSYRFMYTYHCASGTDKLQIYSQFYCQQVQSGKKFSFSRWNVAYNFVIIDYWNNQLWNCEVVAFSEIMVALSQFRHLGTISTSRFLLGVTNVRCDQSFIFGLAGLVAVRIFSSILQGIIEVLSCWRWW